MHRDSPGHSNPGPSSDTATARRRMVDEQLRRSGITDQRVLDAMAHVPREEFVPTWQRANAYADRPLEIGNGQTISQPFVVAATLEAAQLTATDRVLDVGTGSGYAAAVAALLAETVISIERVEHLGRTAARRLARLGYDNVQVHVGDGSLGRDDGEPFDAILCGAAAPMVPRSWRRQLVDGGRIVAPVGPRQAQILIRLTRRADDFEREELYDVRYVPLIGEQGFADS